MSIFNVLVTVVEFPALSVATIVNVWSPSFSFPFSFPKEMFLLQLFPVSPERIHGLFWFKLSVIVIFSNPLVLSLYVPLNVIPFGWELPFTFIIPVPSVVSDKVGATLSFLIVFVVTVIYPFVSTAAICNIILPSAFPSTGIVQDVVPDNASQPLDQDSNAAVPSSGRAGIVFSNE